MSPVRIAVDVSAAIAYAADWANAGLTGQRPGWDDGRPSGIVEVVMTSSNAERLPHWPTHAEHVSAEELARRQGVGPVTSPADMARPGAFESDDELDEFLADLYASRRAGMARTWSCSTRT